MRERIGGLPQDESDPEAYPSSQKRQRKARIIAEKIGDLTGIKVGKPEFSWSAAFGTTSDGLPMIGRLPDHRHVYAAMGFGGNGITFSKIAADIVSSAILGGDDPDSDLFPFAPGAKVTS